jgi:hypothetical protein
MKPGTQFGRLTVLRKGEPIHSGSEFVTTWVCRCACGNEVTVRTKRLNAGLTKSCGCLSRDLAAARLKKSQRHCKPSTFVVDKEFDE